MGCGVGGIAIGFLSLDLTHVRNTSLPARDWPRCKLKADDPSAAAPATHLVCTSVRYHAS